MQTREKMLELREKAKANGHTFENQEFRNQCVEKSIATRKAKKERRRSMQEIAKWLGNMTVTKGEVLDADEIQDLEMAKSVNMTVNEAMILAQYQRALVGDTKAAEFIRDTAGEKPKDEIEVHGMTIDEYAQNHKPKF